MDRRRNNEKRSKAWLLWLVVPAAGLIGLWSYYATDPRQFVFFFLVGAGVISLIIGATNSFKSLDDDGQGEGGVNTNGTPMADEHTDIRGNSYGSGPR